MNRLSCPRSYAAKIAGTTAKHKFQNVFAMTLAGSSLLCRLDSAGYTIVLDSDHPCAKQRVFETYPRAVANRIGFRGSYKKDAVKCLEKAEDYLRDRGISLDFSEQVRQFCVEYRTAGDDPDAADAFLCLVAAIAFQEGLAEHCPGDADPATLRAEGAVIVPVQRIMESHG